MLADAQDSVRGNPQRFPPRVYALLLHLEPVQYLFPQPTLFLTLMNQAAGHHSIYSMKQCA